MKLRLPADKRTRSKQLKEEVATLQNELAELAGTQSEMDKTRADEKAVYEKNKPGMDQACAQDLGMVPVGMVPVGIQY